jgi:quinoprotein glucose dehydrogenase
VDGSRAVFLLVACCTQEEDAAGARPAFGVNGQVSLTAGIKTVVKGEYHFTSPPAVVGEVVIVGSAINDNDRVEMPDRLEPQDAWGLTAWDRGKCRDEIAGLRRGGIFTPPSLQGTLQYPGNIGGTNWGGVSFDRSRGLIVVNQTNLPFIVQLIPREQAEHQRREAGWEYAPMKGTPYVMRRRPLLSPWHLPCNPPPWGTLAAVEASTGRIRWQAPLGTMRELAPIPLSVKWGTPTLGGPLTTASGLTFIGATLDRTFRAFDTETGRELWQAKLPASAMATPITYRARQGGRQYVVVAAGGHGKTDKSKLGDSVMAFALP